MFCKKCGKEIASDSVFCKHCGAKQDIDKLENLFAAAEKDNNKAKIEVYDGHKPEKEEQKQKNKSAFANEIISIGKLLLVALLLWSIYMVGFIAYRSNDIKPSPELPFGSSCYDPKVITGDYILSDADAERVFSELVFDEKQRGRQKSEYMTLSNGIRIRTRSSWSEMTEQEKTEWKKQEIEKGRADWDENLNSIREYAYEKELKNNLLWSIAIILGVLLVSRLIFKSAVWVNKNKTN